MPTLTIRNLAPEIQKALRVRAAQNGRSLEAEVRETLRHSVQGKAVPEENLATWVRKRFKGIEVELPIPPRRPSRARPDFR